MGYLTVCLPEFCGWLGIQLDYWVVYDLSISCIIYITIIKYGVYLNSTFMGISCLVQYVLTVFLFRNVRMLGVDYGTF